METYLFYSYLKFAKNNKQKFWPKLLSRPISVVVFFILTLLACIVGGVYSFIDLKIAIISLIFEIIFGAIFYVLTEKYQIAFCNTEYDKYKQYCLKLLEYFEPYGVNKENINEINEAIYKKLLCLKSEEEKIELKEERWLQTLVIPIILALITAVITKQQDVENMILWVFIIVFLFVFAYVGVSVVKRVCSFPKKRKIKQWECFSSDLSAASFIIGYQNGVGESIKKEETGKVHKNKGCKSDSRHLKKVCAKLYMNQSQIYVAKRNCNR